VSLENEDLEELTGEIRRIIASNKAFLERMNDEEYQCDQEEDEDSADDDLEEYEEL
jgi:hypothetical protein